MTIRFQSGDDIIRGAIDAYWLANEAALEAVRLTGGDVTAPEMISRSKFLDSAAEYLVYKLGMTQRPIVYKGSTYDLDADGKLKVTDAQVLG